MRRPGLRARVTAGFALGALLVSACVALLSYQLTEQFLLSQREATAQRTVFREAEIVRAALATDPADIGAVLRSLDTGVHRRPAVLRTGEWYGRSAGTNLDTVIPALLQEEVAAGRPAVQRVATADGPVLIIGVPLQSGDGFYVVDSMNELDRSLQTLGLVLFLVAAVTTAAGAGLGAYAARYVLRPLASVATAARDITAGDITARLDPAAEPELAHLTTSFNEMVDQLSARMRRDRRFAADVSHELRSPLQTLSAAASVLARRADHLDPRTATAVVLVVDEIDRFQTLVTDLLELARSDQPADVAAVDVAGLARQLCDARGLPADIVTTDPADGMPWNVDRRRMERILANLLDNASRHGGGATAVHLATDTDAHVIHVDDEGPGVNPADRATIFDRFVRGRTAGARGDSDGTGLGLALVAQHAAAHHGAVTVTDRPGGGARFRVELPRQQS